MDKADRQINLPGRGDITSPPKLAEWIQVILNNILKITKFPNLRFPPEWRQERGEAGQYEEREDNSKDYVEQLVLGDGGVAVYVHSAKVDDQKENCQEAHRDGDGDDCQVPEELYCVWICVVGETIHPLFLCTVFRYR